jgi:hypothetical protein
MKAGYGLLVLMLVSLAIAVLCFGCVERRLTINTEPEGALVFLNDEEVGVSPVTASFNWYGDYSVRISKQGYETLNTHRRLKGPWYDHFPFDFFAQILPGRTNDSYEWKFTLGPKVQSNRETLIESARKLRRNSDN